MVPSLYQTRTTALHLCQALSKGLVSRVHERKGIPQSFNLPLGLLDLAIQVIALSLQLLALLSRLADTVDRQQLKGCTTTDTSLTPHLPTDTFTLPTHLYDIVGLRVVLLSLWRCHGHL